MRLSLTYLVCLSERYSRSQFRVDVFTGFSGLPAAKAMQMDETQVELSEIGAANEFQLHVTLDSDILDLINGGASRLLSTLLGNPLRHEGIEKAVLTHVDFDPDLLTAWKGPSVGLNGIKTLFGAEEMPLRSVPLPTELDESGRRVLLQELCRHGIRIFTDSPTTTTTYCELERTIALLSNLSEEKRTPLAYFVNGTVTLSALLRLLETLTRSSPDRLLLGIRLCPLSMGLNVVSYIRDHDIPIYGYNLLPVPGPATSGHGVNAGTLAKIFRVVGCDLVNVGLRAKRILDTASAEEIVQACTQLVPITSSTPVITGSLTPRMAYDVVLKYGRDIVLHVKKPILRSGYSGNGLARNALALKEAVNLAIAGTSIDEAMAREGSDTKYWREYEALFGSN